MDAIFILLGPYPNIRTVPYFQRIYYLPSFVTLSCSLFTRHAINLVFSAFTARPISLLA